MTKIPYFSYEKVNRALYPLWINAECLLWYIFIWGHSCTCLSKKRRQLSKLDIYKIHGKFVRRWEHQHTHLNIHIDGSRNVSLKTTKLKKFISSLFFPRFLSVFHCSIRNVLIFLLNWIKPGPDFPFKITVVIITIIVIIVIMFS